MAQNRRAWGDADRARFADGVRDKAHTFADKKKKHNRNECRKFRWKGE